MLPIIFGVSGLELTSEERVFLEKCQPFGYILFRRNIDTPQQTKKLVNDLCAVSGRSDTPILIDQEGGRVQRLRPPHWVSLPAAQALGDLYAYDADKGIEATKLQAQVIAGQLSELGINVVCAPVLDVPIDGAHDVIGDRAFARNPETIATLGAIFAQELLEHGVTPIIKHLPGHGRAHADSHYDCPVLDTDLAELTKTDFYPFTQVAKNIGAEKIWAMTAHIVYNALDKSAPFSVSPSAIAQVKKQLSIDSLLLSDTIEMEGLSGAFPERALATIQAGCDLTMYCPGDLPNMQAIAAVLPQMSDSAIAKAQKANVARICSKTIDWRKNYAELQQLLTIRDTASYVAHKALTEA